MSIDPVLVALFMVIYCLGGVMGYLMGRRDEYVMWMNFLYKCRIYIEKEFTVYGYTLKVLVEGYCHSKQKEAEAMDERRSNGEGDARKE